MMNKDNTYQKVISIFSMAGLMTAFISLITTQNGLQQYTFSQKWQAFLISCAIQSALFACNMKGPEILESLSRGKKAIFIIFYGIMLMASSCFSFVYILETAYPEDVLRNDATRIMTDEFIEIDYMLSENITKMSTKILEQMEEYLDTLSINNNSNSQILNLQEYIDKLNEKSEDLAENMNIDENVSILVNNLTEINNTSPTKTQLENIRQYIKQLLEDLKSQNEELSSNHEKYSEAYKNATERLTSFNDIESPEYQSANDNVKDAKDKMDDIYEKISNNTKTQNILSGVLYELDKMESGSDFSILQTVDNIRICLNSDDLSEEALDQEVKQIYSILINSDVDEDDDRLKMYQEFKKNSIEYEKQTQLLKRIEDNIEGLYNIYSEINSNIEEIEDSWKQKWLNQFEAIRRILKDAPEDAFNTVNTTINSRIKIIKRLSNQERLYVTDLNAFDKSWTLLFSSHEYKQMVIFALLFAIFLDVFSALMGMIAYLYGKNNMRKEI